MSTALYAPPEITGEITADDLLGALLLAETNGLEIEARGETLIVRPTGRARLHAPAIAAAKPALLRLAAMDWGVADRVMGAAQLRNAATLRGCTVPVIEHTQCEHPDVWAEILAAREQIDTAARSGDWPAFRRGVAALVTGYVLAKETWERETKKPKK